MRHSSELFLKFPLRLFRFTPGAALR